MKRVLLLGIFLLIPSAARAAETTDGTTPPVEKPADPKQWGDASFNAVERFGQLVLPSPEVGKSGLVRGSGLEVRFVMPVAEWGAYYRYVTSATRNNDGFEWSHSEFMMGFSRRLMHVGRRDLWSPRASAHLDVGFGYTTVGTHQSCNGNVVPLSTSCETGNDPHRPTNATSDALALEARVGADLTFGILFLGVDVGASVLARITTGSNSVSAPGIMYLPSGQLRLGIGFPFS
ncbi:MAG: hypothetical protein ACXVEF_27655 [Polyangiales bacterium]